GTLLATSSFGCPVRIWDLPRRRVVAQLTTASDVQIRFSPDGTLLAAGSNANTVELWDTKTWRPKATPGPYRSARKPVAFSPDGRILASGWKDQKVRLWDLRSGKDLLLPEDHTGPPNGLAFSPGGRLLASGDHEGTVRIWSLAGGSGRLAVRLAAAFPSQGGRPHRPPLFPPRQNPPPAGGDGAPQ